jgi:outer membrane protein assembly factor BamB
LDGEPEGLTYVDNGRVRMSNKCLPLRIVSLKPAILPSPRVEPVLNQMKLPQVLLFVALFALSNGAWSADWNRFRGPDGLGSSADRGLPTEWSSSKNVAWKTKLPGAGTSSPIVVGNRIYLTSYSGYALSVDKPGDIENLSRQVLCLDRATGEIIWTKEIAAKQPESAYRSGNDSWHGYASSTPTADDKNLYVFFGKSGVFAFDLADGKEVWQADVGDKVKGWGTGNSLVLFENLLIVNASVESETLRALDKSSGKEVWKVSVGGGARNTPLLVKTAAGSTELVLSLPNKIAGYDPRTGEQLWTSNGIPDGGYICPSVVAHDGIVYAIGGRKNTAVAVRAGGKGDVTETHELWRTNKGSNVSSPVYHDGRLYWMHEKLGTLICLDAKTGETIFEERVSPRPGIVYSSAMVADGKIYAVSQHAGTFVFDAGKVFKQLAHNTFDEDHRANASLAVDRGQLLLRDDGYLYCLGSK